MCRSYPAVEPRDMGRALGTEAQPRATMANVEIETHARREREEGLKGVLESDEGARRGRRSLISIIRAYRDASRGGSHLRRAAQLLDGELDALVDDADHVSHCGCA